MKVDYKEEIEKMQQDILDYFKYAYILNSSQYTFGMLCDVVSALEEIVDEHRIKEIEYLEIDRVRKPGGRKGKGISWDLALDFLVFFEKKPEMHSFTVHDFMVYVRDLDAYMGISKERVFYNVKRAMAHLCNDGVIMKNGYRTYGIDRARILIFKGKIKQ